MKRILLSIFSAFMVSTMASAQYLNVKMDDGTYRSFKTSSKTEVSFGAKAGAEPTEQMLIVNGHQVIVKLADDTPASDVMVSAYSEEEIVKIEAFSKLNHGLWCSTDDNAEVSAKSVTNGFHTFELSNITKDMVVTIGYINVWYDLNNSGMNGNFTAKPEDITKIGYNATIEEPDRLFSDKYGFRGWYKDKECTEEEAWDFSTSVTKSMTLYAKWAEDPTVTQINGHDFVKLGGYYWATENVGYCNYIDNDYDATYGYYYDYDNAIEAARTWNNGSSAGYSWTLPSSAQWQALDYCNWEWKENYNNTGKNGMLVTGRADNYESGHSIFLPAAGYYGLGSVYERGYYGHYWSSTSDGSSYANSLFFYSGDQHVNDNYRDYGDSVRPVLAED